MKTRTHAEMVKALKLVIRTMAERRGTDVGRYARECARVGLETGTGPPIAWDDGEQRATTAELVEAAKELVRESSDPAHCPHCGAYWPPTMMDSYSFPGSACDIGECEPAEDS
jgi:hypothetical protein